MSRSLLWSGSNQSILKQSWAVVYYVGISMSRRFQKVRPSVRPSVRSFVYDGNKNEYSIINSRIMIRISDKRALRPLQENESMFSKMFQTFMTNIPKSCVFTYPSFVIDVKMINGT